MFLTEGSLIPVNVACFPKKKRQFRQNILLARAIKI